MKNIYRLAISVLYVIFFTFAARAQEYQRTETETVLSGPYYALIQTPDSGYIHVSHPERDDHGAVVISRFDAVLKQVYSASLNELSHLNVLGLQYIDKRLYLICEDKERNMTRYEVNDKTGQLSGPPLPLLSCEGQKDGTQFYWGSSPDYNYHFFMYKSHKKKDDAATFNGIITDHQMNPIRTFSYTTPENRNAIGFTQGVMYNNGMLTIIYSISEKVQKNSYKPWIYNLVQIDKQGKSTAVALPDIPEGDFTGISWLVRGNKLLFSGLLRKKSDAGVKSLVSGEFDPLSGKTSAVRQTDFAQMPFFKNAPEPYLKDIAEKGLPFYVNLANVIYFDDGSRALVWEADDSYSVYNGSYTITYFRSYFAYIMKLNANGEPQWMRVIAKKQDEGDFPLHEGIAWMPDNKHGMHGFFFDSKRHKSAEPDGSLRVTELNRVKTAKLVSVDISEDGKISKQFLPANGIDKFYLYPHTGAIYKANELIYISLRFRWGITPDAGLRNSRYHLGLLKLKMSDTTQ